MTDSKRNTEPESVTCERRCSRAATHILKVRFDNGGVHEELCCYQHVHQTYQALECLSAVESLELVARGGGR